MPKFNEDVIIHELLQTLFCDVWIVLPSSEVKKIKGVPRGV